MLENNIHKYKEYGQVSVIGDLNARCGERSDILPNTRDYDKYKHILDKYEYSKIGHPGDLPVRFVLWIKLLILPEINHSIFV